MSFVAGDTASKLEVTCKDNDSGDIIDLTGATVVLKWKTADDSLVTKTMAITNAVGGIAEYQFVSADLFAPEMRFEIRITDGSGKILHSLALLREAVRDALA